MNKLHLIPNTLGSVAATEVLPVEVLQIVYRLRLLFVENLKTTRHFLKSAGISAPYDHIRMEILDKRDQGKHYADWYGLVEAYEEAGLVSECGLPAVADPGEDFIRYLHGRENVHVVAHPGPSAVFMALAASGLNGEAFRFHGYLPVKTPERKQRIHQIEAESALTGATQLFMEAPYRNQTLFMDLLEVLQPQTWLCVALGLQQENEWVKTKQVNKWKQHKHHLTKDPAMFLLQATPSKVYQR